jgi:hypothetical protein
MPKDESKKTWVLKRKKSIECPKPELISQTCNPLNLRPEVNQESQFPTNLMLMDETKKLSI